MKRSMTTLVVFNTKLHQVFVTCPFLQQLKGPVEKGRK